MVAQQSECGVMNVPKIGDRQKVNIKAELVEMEWRGGITGWQIVREHIHDACIVDAKAGEPPRLPTNSAKRKDVPIYSVLFRYFPDAIAEIARLAKAGNDKHNPGEPLHWSRGKSSDHLDCIARHMVDAGTVDDDGFLHDTNIAIRALMNLQVTLERVRGLPISPGSKL